MPVNCVASALLIVLAVTVSSMAQPEDLPNFVILLADDLGYGDLGSYGAEDIETPNLDQLAAEGMRLTSFYAAESACSQTRASLLTASYPLRAGVPTVLFPATLWGFNPAEITFAEIARDAGYATAAVGKWHLGDHPVFLPTNHGFDSYFGIPYSNDMSPVPANNPWPDNRERHPRLPLVEDTTIIEREPDQRQLTWRYTERALDFIDANQDRPFVLYLAYTMPHVPLFASNAFAGRSERGVYGDVVSEIDWSVGHIMTRLKELDLDEETLVLFTSDNGPWLLFGNHGGSAGPLREGKATSFEGGQRVPAIAWMPGTIEAGSVSDDVATVMDILPTVASSVGTPLPGDRVIDGRNLWPILTGDRESIDPYEAFFYYRDGRLEAVRSGPWKLHVPHSYLKPRIVGMDGDAGEYDWVDMELSLYNLDLDIGETRDVASLNPAVVERLMNLIERGRREIGDYITEVNGSQARPELRLDDSWGQNPLRSPEDRVSSDPSVFE